MATVAGFAVAGAGAPAAVALVSDNIATVAGASALVVVATSVAAEVVSVAGVVVLIILTVGVDSLGSNVTADVVV